MWSRVRDHVRASRGFTSEEVALTVCDRLKISTSFSDIKETVKILFKLNDGYFCFRAEQGSSNVIACQGDREAIHVVLFSQNVVIVERAGTAPLVNRGGGLRSQILPPTAAVMFWSLWPCSGLRWSWRGCGGRRGPLDKCAAGYASGSRRGVAVCRTSSATREDRCRGERGRHDLLPRE